MRQILITLSGDWADEFDVFGQMICPPELWAKQLKYIADNANEEINWYFGSNEGFDDATLGEFFKEYYTTTTISEETCQELTNSWERTGNMLTENDCCYMGQITPVTQLIYTTP